jgi:hypothetical protein
MDREEIRLHRNLEMESSRTSFSTAFDSDDSLPLVAGLSKLDFDDVVYLSKLISLHINAMTKLIPMQQKDVKHDRWKCNFILHLHEARDRSEYLIGILNNYYKGENNFSMAEEQYTEWLHDNKMASNDTPHTQNMDGLDGDGSHVRSEDGNELESLSLGGDESRVRSDDENELESQHGDGERLKRGSNHRSESLEENHGKETNRKVQHIKGKCQCQTTTCSLIKKMAPATLTTNKTTMQEEYSSRKSQKS